MAVIDLRGEVRENLALIGKSIGSIISSIKGPDAADRKAFFKKIQDDPELLNTFGKITRDNPGVLQGMFPFLRDEDIEGFQGVLPTLDDLREDIERPGLTPEAAGGGLPPEVATALSEFARAREVGAKPVEVALEPKRVAAAEAIPQEAVTAGMRRDVTGLTPGQSEQDKFNLEIFNTANTAFGELGLDEQKAAALRAKLPSVYFDADVQESFRQRRVIAQMQIDAQNLDRANERTDAFQRSVAARWVASTNVGTPETWQLFLFTQEMNERAKGLATESIIPQNQTDIRLMEVASAFSRADQVDKVTQEAAVRTQIRAIIDRIGRMSEGSFVNERTVRQVLTEQLNSAFVELSMLTDGRIPIRIGEIPDRFGPGKGNEPLKIRDESGEEIEIGQDVERFREGTPSTQAPLELNLETVDASKLSPITRRNLIKIMNGEGTFEELQTFDPASAQMILDARRGR
jgi:hypothetical protein